MSAAKTKSRAKTELTRATAARLERKDVRIIEIEGAARRLQADNDRLRADIARLTEETLTLEAMVRRTAREMSEPRLRAAVIEELDAMKKGGGRG